MKNERMGAAFLDQEKLLLLSFKMISLILSSLLTPCVLLWILLWALCTVERKQRLKRKKMKKWFGSIIQFNRKETHQWKRISMKVKTKNLRWDGIHQKNFIWTSRKAWTTGPRDTWAEEAYTWKVEHLISYYLYFHPAASGFK